MNIPYANNEPLKATTYQDRQYVKPFKAARKLLKKAAEDNGNPNFGRTKITDPGLNATKNFFNSVKTQHRHIPEAYVEVLIMLSSSSSTTSLFQPFERKFVGQILEKLVSETDILAEKEFEFGKKVHKKYPYFYKILSDIKKLTKE